MLIKMRKTLAVVFKLLEASLTPDTENDCTTIFAADVAANPPVTVSSFEVRFPTYLVVEISRGCTLANDSGLMGRNC